MYTYVTSVTVSPNKSSLLIQLLLVSHTSSVDWSIIQRSLGSENCTLLKCPLTNPATPLPANVVQCLLDGLITLI